MDNKKEPWVKLTFQTPSQLQKLLGEGYRITALLLERCGEWDLVAVDQMEKGEK